MNVKQAPTLENLAERFGLTVNDCLDERTRKLLGYKLQLDTEIFQLLAGGAREARISRMATLLGFREPLPWRIAALIKGVLDSRDCVAGLRPKKAAPSKPDATT
jgi:hypothetical protein